MSKMVLGLDLATHTGWALCVDGKIEHSGVWDFSKTRDGIGMHNGHMFLALNRELSKMTWYGEHRIDGIMYERAHHRGGSSTRIPLGLVATVLTFAAQARIGVQDVAANTLKKWATGSGGADKCDMMKAASERTGRTIDNDDEADAVLLAMYGWEKLNEPDTTD